MPVAAPFMGAWVLRTVVTALTRERCILCIRISYDANEWDSSLLQPLNGQEDLPSVTCHGRDPGGDPSFSLFIFNS